MQGLSLWQALSQTRHQAYPDSLLTGPPAGDLAVSRDTEPRLAPTQAAHHTLTH